MSQNPTESKPVEGDMAAEVVEKVNHEDTSSTQNPATESSLPESESSPEAEKKQAQESQIDPKEEQLQQMTTELFSLKDQNAALKEELSAAQDNMLRAQAEVQNINRRSQQDVEKAHKFALEKFSNSLLPILDSLERGLDSAETEEAGNNAVKEGMELTLKLFLDTLAKFNILPINPEPGESFNHEHHQAISQQESSDYDHGSVLSVFQKGYSLNDRLIRPAMVIVAKAPSNK